MSFINLSLFVPFSLFNNAKTKHLFLTFCTTLWIDRITLRDFTYHKKQQQNTGAIVLFFVVQIMLKLGFYVAVICYSRQSPNG